MYQLENKNLKAGEESHTKFRSIIGASQIKEIVTTLNNFPFDENLTLFSFDEMNKKDLKRLLFKILKEIESDFKADSDQNLNDEEIESELIEIMSVINYPAYHDKIGESLNKGEDTTEIKAVIYFLLSNLETCQKRTYLGKYLVGVPVPDEFLMDPEIKSLESELTELMSYFKEEHEELMKDHWGDDQLNYQKEEINQLEREKEQLIIRLKTYQHSGTQTKEFKEILKATSNLREVQEEEARLTDKLYDQQKMLENYESEILVRKQRVKTLEEKNGAEVTASDLMFRIENEKKMMNQYAEELDNELKDKVKRSESNEVKLEMNIPDESQLHDMQSVILKLRAIIEDLDNQLINALDEEKEERLQIFRKQVGVVEKKKLSLEDELNDIEEERLSLEIHCQSLKQEMKEKGIPLQEIEFNDLTTFQKRLQTKMNERNSKQEEINNLQRENYILDRTFLLLKKETNSSETIIKDFEDKFGMHEALGESLNQDKWNSLKELDNIIQNLSTQIAEKKIEIQPLLNKQKELKQEISIIEKDHKSKKENYLNSIQGLKEEYSALVSAVNSKRKEVFAKEIQKEQLSEKGRVLKLYLDLMSQQLEYSNSSQNVSSRLNGKFRSHSEWMDARVEQVESDIKVLKGEREMIQKESQKKSKQIQFVQNLFKIMQIKNSSIKENQNLDHNRNNSGDHDKSTLMTHRETYNRLVME